MYMYVYVYLYVFVYVYVYVCVFFCVSAFVRVWYVGLFVCGMRVWERIIGNVHWKVLIIGLGVSYFTK